jgi:DNA (cytosine-5)-methyltransferase 1
MLPTPRATDGTKGGPNQRGSSGDLMLPSAVTLLPTPMSRDHKTGYQPGGAPPNRVGSAPLNDVVSLLPAPSVADGMGGHMSRSGDRSGELLLPGVAAKLLPTPMVGSTNAAAHGQVSGQWREQMAQALEQWGDYADAITRWEAVTRPAPAPTMTSRKGNPQLSPAFSEWMMGLPAGWVTDVPGITRNEALRALGNGVVPQQAAAAVSFLLDVLVGRRAA